MGEIDPVKYAELVEEVRALREKNKKLIDALVNLRCRAQDLDEEAFWYVEELTDAP